VGFKQLLPASRVLNVLVDPTVSYNGLFLHHFM